MDALRSPVQVNLEAILERIKQAEAYYKGLPTVEFRRSPNSPKIKLKKDNDVESFIRKFFDKFNKEYKTYIVDGLNITEYCGLDTRRSIEDVFRTSYSYLGDRVNLKDLIIQTYKNNMDEKIGSNWCTQILKRVYRDRGQTNGVYYDAGKSDELGFTKEHYKLLANS